MEEGRAIRQPDRSGEIQPPCATDIVGVEDKIEKFFHHLCAPCPSMFASIRMTGTVLLHLFFLHFFLEPGHPLFSGQVFLAGRENSAARALRLHAALVELLRLSVFLHQFVVVVVHLGDDGVELGPSEARHGPVNEIEIVPAVKVVKNVQHRDTASGKLRASTSIDDLYGSLVHAFFLLPLRELRMGILSNAAPQRQCRGNRVFPF